MNRSPLNLYWLRTAGVALLVLLYVGFPNPTPDFTPFNVNDAESYVALSYNLTHGRGYTRNPGEDYIPHTTWPPGMAVLLAPVTAWMTPPIDWAIVKLPVLLVSLLTLVVAWAYLKRWFESSVAADIGTLALALNPYFWHLSRTTLGEVPVVCWAFFGLLWLDVLLAKRKPSHLAMLLAGGILGLGLLIKGSLVALAMVPLGYLVGERRTRLSARSFLVRYGIFLLGFVLAAAAWSVRNSQIDTVDLGFDGIDQTRMVLASSPTDPASELRDPNKILTDSFNNIKWGAIPHAGHVFVPFAWLERRHSVQWLSALLLPLGALAAVGVLVGIWRSPSVFLMLASMASLTIVLAAGSAIRYWIPVYVIALTVASGQLAVSFFAAGGRRATRVLISVGLLYLFSLVFYVAEFSRMPFSQERHVSELAALQFKIRALGDGGLPQPIFSPHSESFWLTTGLTTSLVNESFGVNPRFAAFIVKGDGILCRGCKVAVKKDPWRVVVPTRPMTKAEFFGAQPKPE